MPRKKLTPIKTLERKLTKLVYNCVFARDNNRCQVCNKWVKGSDRQPSHVYPKARSKYLRWDMKNIKTLCWKHHLRWWHTQPLESGKWFEGKFPERVKYIKERKNIILSEELKKQGKTYREWLKEQIKKYEQKLSDFGYSLSQPPR